MTRGYLDEEDDTQWELDDEAEFKCLNCGHEGPARKRGDETQCVACKSPDLEEVS